MFRNIPVRVAEELKKHPVFYRSARKVYCRLFPPIRSKVERALSDLREVCFLKIGANDGLGNDPLGDLILTDLRFKGVLVEPIPFIARKLAANYPDRSRFKIENAAISQTSGMARMFCVAEDAVDAEGRQPASWISGIGSFNREHVLRHLPPELQGAIQEVEVPCLTFEELVSRSHLSRLDLVHIDTEGHDFVIVQQINFNRWRPKIVLFEHKHLKDSDKADVRSLMEKNGYKASTYDSDFLCVDIQQ